jgi:hypothetical protein
MSLRIDPDFYRSSSMENVLGSLKGPLAGGAASTPLTLDGSGRLTVSWTSQRPMALAVLKVPLGTESMVVQATLDPGGAATVLPPIRFESYSEAGASLPVYVPDVSLGVDSIPGFVLDLKVSILPEFGAASPVASADIGKFLRFEMIEGNVGKLLFTMLQEKARIRRQAREIAAMRFLPTARRDALDRIGAGLGVLRFQDDLAYDAVKDEVLTVIMKDAGGNATLESDADYAGRIALYHPFLLSSPDRFGEILNGEGGNADPNTGLLSGLGLTSRFIVQEENNPFALAFRIVGIGSAAPRTNFLNYARSDVLIWIPNSAAANAAHDGRYLPQATLDRVAALRQRLRAAYSYPADAAVAPMLANALDRLGRVLKALGYPSKVSILRAQNATAGSRYELGLGCDIAALATADLNDLVARVGNVGRTVTDDHEAEALITAARAHPTKSPADDPDGKWLFETCGFGTVHRLTPTSLYISHLPMLGLQVDGPTTVALGTTGTYSAHFYPPEDPAINAALYAGLAASTADWAAAGRTAWTQLSTADGLTAWNQVVSQAPNAPAQQIFAAAGLPAVANPASLITSLKSVPADMLATIRLDPTLAARVLAGNPDAATALASLVAIFKTHSLASAVPVVTSGNQVLLVVSVLGLPQVGVNLSDRRTSGFRWYAVPLGGQATVKPLGSGTTLQPTHAGALALVCLGYVRQGKADPYEVKIDLPKGETISLKEYEFLMNALEHLCPIGVEINTYSIRQNHVDLAGDGVPKPLRPAVFRTYRSFRRRRLRGIYQEGQEQA